MKLNLRDGQVAEKNYTPTKAKNIGIDHASMDLLGMLITQGLYSNPIGSSVRELSSNSWDSHIEADKASTPIVAGIREDNNGYFFFAQDFGVGISPYRFENIFGNLLSSTKRDTNDQLGAFGLGSKSPLSYTNIFYLTTVYEGIEYGYSIYVDGSKTTQEELYQLPSKEENGTIVKVYLKKNADMDKFINECKRQLVYFDNIIFEFPGEPEINDYKIFRGKSFMYSPISTHTEVHAILGKVAYPIDWQEIGMKRVEVPIGLRFEVGDFGVTPSRESIQYDEDIAQKIHDRIVEASTELAELFNSNPYNHTFEDIIDFGNRFEKGVPKVWLGDSKFSLLGTRSYTDVELEKPKINRFGDLDCTNFDPNHPTNHFVARNDKYISEDNNILRKVGSKKAWDSAEYKPDVSDLVTNAHKFLWYESKYNSAKKNIFIADTRGTTTLLMNMFDVEEFKPKQVKVPDLTNPGKDRKEWVIPVGLITICKMFNITELDPKSKTDRKTANNILKLYAEVYKEAIANIEHYKDIEITQEWWDAYKVDNPPKKREKSKFRVGSMTAYSRRKYGGNKKYVKWGYTDIDKLDTEESLKTCFGEECELILVEKSDIYQYSNLLTGWEKGYIHEHFPNACFIHVAQSNEKYLEDIDCIYSWDEWCMIEREQFNKYVTLTALQERAIDDRDYNKVDEFLGTDFAHRVAEFNKIESKLDDAVDHLKYRSLFSQIALQAGKEDTELVEKKTILRMETDKHEYLRYFNLKEKGVENAIKAYLFCAEDGEEELETLDFEITNTQTNDSIF